MKNLLYIIIIMLLTLNLLQARSSENPDFDSLGFEIQRLTLEEQIRRYDDLSWQYIGSDTRQAILFGKKGLALAEKAGDNKMEVTFYHTLGTAYYLDAAFDSAAFYLDRAYERLLETKNHGRRMEAIIYVAYGDLYRAMSQYERSLIYHRRAQTLFEQLGDRTTLGKAYKNMAAVYHLMRNSDQAEYYFKEAEKIALETGDMETLASVSASLADLYLYHKENKEASIRYATEAARIFGDMGHLLGQQMALLTLAKVHAHYGEYASAQPLAEEVVRQAEELSYPSLTFQSLNILADIYYHLGRYRESVELAQTVVKQDSANTNTLTSALATLVHGYARLGRFDLMEDNFQQYTETIHSYSNETYQKSLSEMEVKYESEAKNLKIEALEQQRTLHTSLGLMGAVVLLVALAFAVIRYRLAVSRRKLAEQEASRLEQENQLIAVRSALDAEAAERSRLARDLHDGLGSMLSVVKFNLPQMESGAVLESLDVSRFSTALGMLDESIQELRRVAHHMMPESLLRYGLKASLTDFSRSIPKVKFHYFGDEQRLPDKLEVMVYRCIHELVNNALKHAEAEQINIQLIQETDRISFTVQDDGKGFDPEAVSEGMGLRNIRQRVATFDGEMSVYSSDEGTEVHVELNLTPQP